MYVNTGHRRKFIGKQDSPLMVISVEIEQWDGECFKQFKFWAGLLHGGVWGQVLKGIVSTIHRICK